MPTIEKLVSLTATDETCRRQSDDPDRSTLPKVADRLWRAFRQCFPSCETLTEAPENWCLRSRCELDETLYLHRSSQVDESWSHPIPEPGAAIVTRRESASRTTLRVEIRTSTQGRLFAVSFEEHRDAGRAPHIGRAAYRLTKVEVHFGVEGSTDRALALGFEYLDFAPGDREEYDASEVPLLWSAMPEFDALYVEEAPAVVQ